MGPPKIQPLINDLGGGGQRMHSAQGNDCRRLMEALVQGSEPPENPKEGNGKPPL